MTKSNTKFFAFGAVLALCACGSGTEMARQAAPAGPLFAAGTATPETALKSDERSMSGTVSQAGTVTALSPIGQGGATNARVAWDGTQLTLIGGDGSKTYNLSAGDGSVKRYGRPALLKGNGDYAAYLTGTHSAAATYVEESQPSIKLGAFSVGNITQNMAAAPATATYSGTMNGQYVGASTTPYDTYVAATLDANFSGGSFNFDAGAPNSYNTLNGNKTNASGLTMSGSGTINEAAFNGTVIAISGMSGSMSGNFYGPNAQEAGGTVGITGSGGDFVGAFNLKR